MKVLNILCWLLRLVILVILFDICFIAGAQLINGLLPAIKPEPGLVSPQIGVLIIGIANTLLMMGLVLNSRWSGWKLVLGLSLAYYGAVSLLTQIETWYFLYDLTVSPELLPRLFLMGIPVAFIYIPITVFILGKGRSKSKQKTRSAMRMSGPKWIWKLTVLAVIYLILYWSAGYFIAWQNPDLRAFYGSPGEPLSFWDQTVNTLRTDPGLFPFQILRSMLWVLCALPIIRSSKSNVIITAILLGLFFSVPQNIGHILENPLIPSAGVRLSHMLETAISTFVFGLAVAWLLYRDINPGGICSRWSYRV